MFTVTGTINSVPYRVGVHDEAVEDNQYGCVMGSDAATALLAVHEGEYVQQTPTHDEVLLSLTDPASVLAALHEFTNVIDVEGDAPVDPETEAQPGTIY